MMIEERGRDSPASAVRPQPISTNHSYHAYSPLLIWRTTRQDDVKSRKQQNHGDSGFHSGPDHCNLLLPGPISYQVLLHKHELSFLRSSAAGRCGAALYECRADSSTKILASGPKRGQCLIPVPK